MSTEEASSAVTVEPLIVTADVPPLIVVSTPPLLAVTVNTLLAGFVPDVFIASVKVTVSVDCSTVALENVGSTPSTLRLALAATAGCVRAALTVVPAVTSFDVAVARASLFAPKPSPSEASPATTVYLKSYEVRFPD